MNHRDKIEKWKMMMFLGRCRKRKLIRQLLNQEMENSIDGNLESLEFAV